MAGQAHSGISFPVLTFPATVATLTTQAGRDEREGGRRQMSLTGWVLQTLGALGRQALERTVTKG